MVRKGKGWPSKPDKKDAKLDPKEPEGASKEMSASKVLDGSDGKSPTKEPDPNPKGSAKSVNFIATSHLSQ